MTEIDEIKERLKDGDQRFTEVAEALSRIATHLHSQDDTMAKMTAKLDTVAKDTADVVTMWNGGVKAVRFFCRCADAWRFVMSEVVRPFWLPVAAVYGIWYVHEYGRVPLWLIAAFKFVAGAL